jgi:hypothetical protein
MLTENNIGVSRTWSASSSGCNSPDLFCPAEPNASHFCTALTVQLLHVEPCHRRCTARAGVSKPVALSSDRTGRVSESGVCSAALLVVDATAGRGALVFISFAADEVMQMKPERIKIYAA